MEQDDKADDAVGSGAEDGGEGSDFAGALRAVALTPKDGVIVATGSVFLVGEIRPLLLAEREP